MRFFWTALLCSFSALAQQASGQQVSLDTFPMSAKLSPDGRFLLVLHSGTAKPSVQVLDAKTLEKRSRVEVPDAWLGLAISPNGKNVYVSGGATASIFEFSLSNQGELQPARTFEAVPAPQRQPQDLIGDVTLSPDGRLLYAASLYRDRILVINPASGLVIERIPTTRRPYRILFHPDGKSFLVSGWADGAVVHHRAETGEKLGVLRTGPHPTDMVWRTAPPKLEEGEKVEWTSRLFVAAANTNNVYVFGAKEDKTLIPLGSISVALTAQQPAGMTPSALALSTDQNILYIVCSDGNTVSVTDISGTAPLRLGYVSTDEYPTDALSLADGRLFVLNGGANSATANLPELIDIGTAREASPYRDEQLMPPGQKSALEHVIYVIDEGAKGGQNTKKLAKEFVQFSSFHINGSNLTDRVDWAGAAITTDFIRKLSPGVIAGRRKAVEEKTPANIPPAGRLWDNASAKGLTVQSHTETTSIPVDQLPQLTVVRLNHNDRALGSLVEKVSKSATWKSTVIFVVNAEEGSALLISPYTRGRGNDPEAYDTSSVLRTIELILGLQPMTQFDASAVPMTASFGNKPDVTPYVAVQ